MIAALVVSLCVAQTSPQIEAMRGDLKQYFAGETSEAWAFGGLGLVSVGAGAGFLASGRSDLRGASVPLFAVGLIQLALAIGLWARTPAQVATLETQLTSSPGDYRQVEGARMKRVMQGFAVYKAAEVALFFGGIALSGAGGLGQSDFAVGAGFALAAEAVVMLILDFYAEGRGRLYEAAISGFRF